MTIDINELRDRAATFGSDYLTDEEWVAVIDRLEAAERDVALKEKVIDALGSELNAVAKERDALRAKITEMEKQEPAGWQRLYEDGSSTEDIVDSPNVFAHQRPLYALPGAQPASSVPREAIEKMLTQLMDIAVSNGANSVSMPDEHVEVAAWLCGIPAQPAPSVPEGWIQRGMAELGAVRSRQDDDTLLDDRTLIERIGKAMLAAAPEAKP